MERESARICTQAAGEGRRERRKLSREPDMGRIPGPWDPDLSQAQIPNQLSYPGALQVYNCDIDYCVHTVYTVRKLVLC